VVCKVKGKTIVVGGMYLREEIASKPWGGESFVTEKKKKGKKVGGTDIMALSTCVSGLETVAARAVVVTSTWHEEKRGKGGRRRGGRRRMEGRGGVGV